MASGQSIKVGNVEILALTDASGPFGIKLSQGMPSITAEQWRPYQTRNPECFADADTPNIRFGGHLIRAGSHTVFVDTGIGPDPIPGVFPDRGGRLPEEMTAKGVTPEEVDAVVITHVHIDHVGWNLTAAGKPLFPRARYLVHQADWDVLPVMEGPWVPPYVDRTLRPLQGLGVLDLINGETAIGEAITVIPTPGHSPGHVSVLIASGGEKAMISGDALGLPAQISEPDWPLVLDWDQEQAIATRKQLIDRIEQEGMTLAVCHFPAPGFGRIVRLESRRYWQAL